MSTPSFQIAESAAVYGARSLPDTDILSLLVGSDTSQLFDDLGLLGLARASVDLLRSKGLTQLQATKLHLALAELPKRLAHIATEQPKSYFDPLSVYQLLDPEMRCLDCEHVIVLCLNRRNHLLKKITISTGTAHSALLHPREIFRQAIFFNASAVIIAHNHPAGDPEPSRADILATRRVREASNAVEIDLLDHIIIGRPGADPKGIGYYSFQSEGLL